MIFLNTIYKAAKPIILLFLMCGFLFSQEAFAQAANQNEGTSIALMAGVRDGKVLIKAFPTTKEAWYYGTRNGIRFSFARMQDGVWTAFVPFQGQPVLPAQAEQFARFSGPGDYARIMQEVIYEQDYVPISQSLADIHATNKEFSNHFFFYLMMSCYHPELSEMSGLQIQIPHELSGNMRIRAEIMGEITYVGEIIINTRELSSSIPTPPLEVQVSDLKVELMWEHEAYAKNIMAYQTYRSDDGEDFTPLGVPIIFNASSAYGKKGMISSSDSLPENYKDYWYKLRGYDVFGYQTDEQPATKVSGSDKTAPGRVKQLTVLQTSPTDVAIQWVHDADDGFAGYQVVGSTAELGEYQKLHDKLLPASQTYFQYNLNAGFYKFFRVMAVDTAYNASVSDIGYLVEVDTIPPPIPSIVSAVCDTAGIVTLKWEASTAPDIKGYRVFKAFHPSHGFHPITPVPLRETSFADTLGKRLEKKVYYRIVALDTHFNHSQPSDYRIANIPDMIPPTAPLIHDGKLNEMGHPELFWKGSSSSDVASYRVFRLIESDSSLSANFDLAPDARSFSDTGFPELGVKYAVYSVSAIDSSGNASERSNIRRVFGTSQGVKTTTAQSADYDGSNVTITWPENNVIEGGAVLIYRAENDGPFTILGRSESGTQYIDQRVQKQYRYTYKLGVVEETGKRWALSAPLEVVISR